MNNDFVKKIIDLKIPSIIILTIFSVLTYNLLRSSPSLNSSQGIAGMICLAVTVFSGIYAFLEQTIKERYESIIRLQQIAMESLSKTHTVVETNKQTSLGDNLSQKSQQQYTEINPSSETKT